MAERYTVRRVREWVNRERVKRGGDPLARLPKAVRNNTTECVLAIAFGGASFAFGGASVTFDSPTAGESLEEGGVWITLSGETLRAPNYVASFVRGFDRGRYPELEGHEKRADLVIATEVMTDTERDEVDAATRDAEVAIREEAVELRERAVTLRERVMAERERADEVLREAAAAVEREGVEA